MPRDYHPCFRIFHSDLAHRRVLVDFDSDYIRHPFPPNYRCETTDGFLFAQFVTNPNGEWFNAHVRNNPSWTIHRQL